MCLPHVLMRFQHILFLSCLVLAITCAQSSGPEPYLKLLDDYYQWRLETSPESASLEGDHRFDPFLSKRSLSDVDKIKSDCQGFADRARKELSKRIALTGIQTHNLKLIEYEAKTCVKGINLKGHLFTPVNFLESPQSGLPDMFNKSSFFKLDTMVDYSIALQRLGKVAGSIEKDVMETLREAIKQNMTMAKESMTRVPSQFKALFVNNTEDSQFYTPFKGMADKGFSDVIVTATQNKAKKIIEDEIFPAFRKLQDFLDNYYSNHYRSGPGVSNLPNGKEYYQACIDFHTTKVNMTAEEIHQIGLKEVERLWKGVAEVAKKIGSGMSAQEFMKALTEQNNQFFTEKEELLDYVKDLVKNKINPKMNEIIPEEYLTDKLYKLLVKPVPPGGGGVAYYNPGAKDGSRDGEYYINIRNIKAFKKFELMALSLHEGNPGHHFDFTVFGHSYKDFPSFLHSPIFGAYSTFPAATPTYTAFIEGWGLYSEFLGFELGLYEDPYSLLGFYSWNLLRASRLVVDTGLHAFDWPRDRAVQYLLDNTAMSKVNAETEIDRYITWPGQALGYKIGEIEIRKIREEMEQEQGDEFDVKIFHKHILACRGPMSMIRDCLKAQRDN